MQYVCMDLGYDFLHYIQDSNPKLIKHALTPFRPTKSAIGPLVIAPIIAPNVKIDPNNEYCKKPYCN